MKIRTNVKAGAINSNHNETQVRDTDQAAEMPVKTRVKAGAVPANHNETQVPQNQTDHWAAGKGASQGRRYSAEPQRGTGSRIATRSKREPSASGLYR